MKTQAQPPRLFLRSCSPQPYSSPQTSSAMIFLLGSMLPASPFWKQIQAAPFRRIFSLHAALCVFWTSVCHSDFLRESSQVAQSQWLPTPVFLFQHGVFIDSLRISYRTPHHIHFLVLPCLSSPSSAPQTKQQK